MNKGFLKHLLKFASPKKETSNVLKNGHQVYRKIDFGYLEQVEERQLK